MPQVVSLMPNSPERRYDCGTFGMLTKRQMARMAGVARSTISKRLHAGWCLERLVSKGHANHGKQHANARKFSVDVGTVTGAIGVWVGYRLRMLYGETVPTPAQLQRDFPGMSRATAYRYVRGIKDALCLP